MNPYLLKPGDTVALLAPASPLPADQLNTAIASVEFFGLKPKLFPSCFAKDGYLAGEDKLRAKDLMDAFTAPDIRGIFCLRGGYGTSRILPLLDYETIRRNPKVLLGYSDITALHTALNQLCGMPTIHGPMLNYDWREMDPLTLGSLRQLLFSEKAPAIFEGPLKTLVPGEAKGPAAGGNLTLLAETSGSPYEIDTRGKILFLEDVNLKPYQLDRALSALALAGKLQACAGIVLCTFTGCEAKEKAQSHSLTLDRIFSDILVPLGKPLLSGFQAGHTLPNLSIPLGCIAHIEENSVRFSYPT